MVEYRAKSAEGKVRHPFFKGFRTYERTGMRLSGIDTIAASNAFLPAFMEQYNPRFAKAPFDDRDVHRALVVGQDDLDDAFAWKEERTVSVNLTLQYDQVLFILEPTGIARSLAQTRHGG
jgi:hypothetical protein